MRARTHNPILLPALLALVPACAPSRLVAPEPPPAAAAAQPETGNEKPKNDLYGDLLPPGAIARLRSSRLRHECSISSVAFSPDGKTLATGNLGEIRLWEADTGKERFEFKGDHRWVDSVAFSPDGKILASRNEDSFRLWDAASGKQLQKIEGRGVSVHSIAFAPDGKRLASGHSNSTILIWDVAALLKGGNRGGR